MFFGLEGGCLGCFVSEDSLANSKGQSWVERVVFFICRQVFSSSSFSFREGGQRRWQAQFQKFFFMFSVRRVTCFSCSDTQSVMLMRQCVSIFSMSRRFSYYCFRGMRCLQRAGVRVRVVIRVVVFIQDIFFRGIWILVLVVVFEQGMAVDLGFSFFRGLYQEGFSIDSLGDGVGDTYFQI